jgi:hypothetical protein
LTFATAVVEWTQFLTWPLSAAEDGYIDVMGETVTRPALDALLAGHKVGTWVVLDPSMSRVLGAGRTPATAMRRAQVAPIAKNPAAKRPVMLQVPDPSMICFL